MSREIPLTVTLDEIAAPLYPDAAVHAAYSAKLRELYAAMDSMQKQIQAGLMSVDEARARLFGI